MQSGHYWLQIILTRVFLQKKQTWFYVLVSTEAPFSLSCSFASSLTSASFPFPNTVEKKF